MYEDANSVYPSGTRRRKQKGAPTIITDDTTAIPAIQVTILREAKVTMTGPMVEVPTEVAYRRLQEIGIVGITIIGITVTPTTGAAVAQDTVIAIEITT